ncbi:hypothetical protein RSAG8_12247, partial [Rhizoctonia solani AG-8 WAC10335]
MGKIKSTMEARTIARYEKVLALLLRCGFEAN